MTLKINASGLVENYINRYLIWRDFQNFYKHASEPVVAVTKDGIPCFEYWELGKINSSDAPVIVINCMTEGIHSRKMFDQYRTDKKYIIFANGDWDPVYHNLKINYALVHHLFFLFEMADTYNSPNRFCYFTDKVYDFESRKEYSFITTIGNVRPERTKLVDKLAEITKNKKCIIRYSGQDYAEPSDSLDVVKFSQGKFDPYIEIQKNYYHSVSQTLPMKMYNSARFNLAVETDINYQHSFFLTEKTVKVLLTGMPFVSMSHPNFLTRLHDLGFTTYGDLWDESYDQEVEFDKRLEQVVQLCDKLCDFDWDNNLEKLELIKLKNQSNFLNLNHVCDKEFLKFEQIIKDIA